VSAEHPGFVDVPLDGLEPERLVPSLPGLGLAMQQTDPHRPTSPRPSHRTAGVVNHAGQEESDV
jgi:hypothetical protein